MTVSAQLLVEELQIFGLDCEEALIEKRESLAPSWDQPRSPTSLRVPSRQEPKGERFQVSPPRDRTSR